nr:IMP dehydrogenase [Akkermansia muciniphila]
MTPPQDHTTRVMDVVSNLRKLTDRPIVAGNVVTAEGAADLIKAGVQAIKVGVGPAPFALPASYPAWACPNSPPFRR